MTTHYSTIYSEADYGYSGYNILDKMELNIIVDDSPRIEFASIQPDPISIRYALDGDSGVSVRDVKYSVIIFDLIGDNLHFMRYDVDRSGAWRVYGRNSDILLNNRIIFQPQRMAQFSSYWDYPMFVNPPIERMGTLEYDIPELSII